MSDRSEGIIHIIFSNDRLFFGHILSKVKSNEFY